MAKQPHHVDAEVGLRLRQARRKQGMSQTELGGRIGVTFQQLQKYEKGTNRISASKMVAICEALNLEPTYFFKDLSNQGEPSQTKPDWEFSKQGRDLIEAFHRINDPRVRKRIVYLVQQVANSNPPDEDD